VRTGVTISEILVVLKLVGVEPIATHWSWPEVFAPIALGFVALFVLAVLAAFVDIATNAKD
jgi:hypothetical protein